MIQKILSLKEKIKQDKIEYETTISKYFIDNKELSITEFAKEINIDRHTLTELLKRNNSYEDRYKRDVDVNFFEKIDNEEKAYWFGFISADGHIGKNRNSIKIALALKDKKHVEKFKKSIKSEHSIIIRKQKAFNNIFEAAEIVINNKKIHSDLYNLGLRNLKINHLLPKDIPDELMHHYLRGLYDGDGWFTLTPRSRELGLGMNKPILEFFNKQIVKFLKIKSRPVKEYKSIFRYRVAHKDDIKKILDWFYEDATVYLDRKYEKYKEFSRLYFNG